MGRTITIKKQRCAVAKLAGLDGFRGTELWGADELRVTFGGVTWGETGHFVGKFAEKGVRDFLIVMNF